MKIARNALLALILGIMLFSVIFIVLRPDPAPAASLDWTACSGIDRGDIVSTQTVVAGAYANAFTRRVAYYRSGHSSFLSGRYWDPARSYVRRSVSGRPLDVPLLEQRWCVQSVQIRGQWATLRSLEWWRVRWSGRSFFERGRSHRVTLRNVQGLTQKKWVVVRIQ